MCRFADYLQRNRTGFVAGQGVTVSGIRTSELKRRIREEKLSLDRLCPLILLVACNDIIRGTSDDRLKWDFLSLIKVIRKKYGNIRLVIIQLPPFPRYHVESDQVRQIEKFNRFLATLGNATTFILRWPFTSQNRTGFFHRFYGRSNRRDMIHLNDRGFACLVGMLRGLLSEINR